MAETRGLEVRGQICDPQRQATSSHARDSKSCSKQSCAMSQPTIKSTHNLIIYAYHEQQDQALPIMSEHATTNQLNIQATTNHNRSQVYAKYQSSKRSSGIQRASKVHWSMNHVFQYTQIKFKFDSLMKPKIMGLIPSRVTNLWTLPRSTDRRDSRFKKK